jgi:salicylate hydroxylase
MIIIAGAGIGGLTAALAIARRGLAVTLLDQAQRLEEIGAGIQLSPNAARVLIELGLAEPLRRHLVAPVELRVRDARTAAVLARSPLGPAAEDRYGAPYWVIHRGDLQAVLLEAVRAQANISLRLDTRVDGFTRCRDGIAVAAIAPAGRSEEAGAALIGADGLWSQLRRHLGHRDEPAFARHTAWRALVPAEAADAALRAPAVNLWLGRDAHLVHYPVRGGSLVNLVTFIRDDWHEPGWNAPADRAELLDRLPAALLPAPVRAILAVPAQWHKWALYDRAPISRWGQGPVTLLGDAAHPMLPYLAQGAAMAIEDAAVLARRLAEVPHEPALGMRRYERQRRQRTARVQRAARRNGAIYHLGGAAAFLRAMALRAMDGERLMRSYDWLYGWSPS